ncbi:ficolin-2-like [Drosophila willistoni]|uniref:ficolin-2-like n=1 Tax=Drosophila willistoni TaxID=7260 RepID=UPI000C26CABA|nr:ficolin-2-like [Drosophila willistoni]
MSGDFFLGLDKLHAITKSQTYELYFQLEDFEGSTRFARYDEFYIENENESYKMTKLGTYTGDAGDSLTEKSKFGEFSTFDRDNHGDCAKERLGAWWHTRCTLSNLFGMYYEGAHNRSLGWTGMSWEAWHGDNYSFKAMKIMIRAKNLCPC